MRLFRLGAALAGLALLIAGTPVLALEASEHVLGDAAAPVTVIEYASLGCPHCAAFQTETLPKLKERYIDTGKVKLVFRDFPLDEVALQAAMLSHCAGPERYGRFVDVYFKQQPSWERASDPAAAIKQLAKLGGLGDDAITSCLADKQLEDSILKARLEAQQKFDVNSTPSFVVGGKTYAGNRSVDEFAQLIEPLLH